MDTRSVIYRDYLIKATCAQPGSYFHRMGINYTVDFGGGQREEYTTLAAAKKNIDAIEDNF